MKFIKGLLVAAAMVLATGITVNAATVNVLAGAFAMNAAAVIGGAGDQFDRLGPLDLSNLMPDDGISGNSAIGFEFGAFGPVDIWTSAVPVLSVGTSDLSGWSIFWNGNLVNQGNAAAATVDNMDGTWTMTWTSLIVGGPFDGKTGNWQVQTTAAVPEPMSMALVGSSLIGLIGLRRRLMA